MKCRISFALKNNEKVFIMLSAAVVIGTLRVKTQNPDCVCLSLAKVWFILNL